MKQYNNRMITNTEVIFWCIAVYKNINIIKKNILIKKNKNKKEVIFFAFSIKAINIIIMYVFIHIFKLFFL